MDRRSESSSGTDDDLPPQQQAPSRSSRPHSNGNGNGSRPALHGSEIEQLVRKLEQDAYTAVLRAFGAQSEVITWDKERLISELRKELRVSDEQHRDLLARVATDDSLRQVRELKSSGEGPSSSRPTLVPHSVKRKKTPTPALPPSQPPPAAAMPPPPPPLPTAAATTSAAPPHKKGLVQRDRPKSSKGAHKNNKSGSCNGNGVLQGSSLVGQTIRMRWPEDGHFYDAFVKEFHHDSREHTLVYDRGTQHETCEKVDLGKVAQDDMQLLAGSSKKLARNPHNNTKKRVVPPERTPPPPSQKWAKIDRKGTGVRHVVLPSLDSLTKQMEDLDHQGEPDPSKLEQTRRMAKEHEGLLRKVLVEMGDSSDEGESDDRGRRNGYRLVAQ